MTHPLWDVVKLSRVLVQLCTNDRSDGLVVGNASGLVRAVRHEVRVEDIPTQADDAWEREVV